EVVERSEYIEISGWMKGGNIDFPISTVGGTENALLCAACADGVTNIRNAYVTPEVSDLIAFLREMGATIELEGSSHIRVNGAAGLLHGATFAVMPDRIEALTWMALAAASGSTLSVANVPFDSMSVPLIHLRDIGIDFLSNSRNVKVAPECIGAHG